MAYRATMIRQDYDVSGGGRTAAFQVATAIEALRTAQEGVRIAREQGRSVTYEVHGPDGGLVVSYSSVGA